MRIKNRKKRSIVNLTITVVFAPLATVAIGKYAFNLAAIIRNDLNYTTPETNPDILKACKNIDGVKLAKITYPIRKFPLYKTSTIIPEKIGGHSDNHEAVRKINAAKRSMWPHYIKVNSHGGLVYAMQDFHRALRSGRSNKITYTTSFAGSAGAMILIEGNQRWATQDARIMFHEARVDSWWGGSYFPYFAHDYKTNTYEHQDLASTNARMRAQLVRSSANKAVSRQCAKTFIKGEKDVYTSATYALKAGWIDAVINKNIYGRYDGTIMVRRSDVAKWKHPHSDRIAFRLNRQIR